MIHRSSFCLWIAALATLVAACGDGDTIPDAGMGMQGSNTVTNVCGDGRVGGSEQCDDGNSASGDGCSNLCTSESPSGGTAGAGGSTGAGDAGTGGGSITQDASVGGAMDATSGTDAAPASDASSADAAGGDAAAATGDAAGPPAPEPLCPAEPPTECEKCNCTMCKTQLDACSNLAGPAAEGPGVGKPKAALCEALVRCGRMTGCRSIACLCTDAASCLAQTDPPPTPDGPCKDEVMAAAEVDFTKPTDGSTFLMRATTPEMGYAVAVASAVSNCAAASCESACAQQ